ncbi:sigma-70 family RNA polymerase sigma factor [Actinomadura sp. DSM 109109]|nr:sigma-70 family RNA polymerase sigma factor [Actinomadura lepetitiana]
MDDRKARFESIYAETYEPIMGYVLRRCPSPDDAADVVAETFTIAWRRLEDVPPGHRARLWLYGVARRVIANHWRGEAQRRRRTTNLRHDLRDEIAAVGADPVEASAIAEAFDRLTDDDREILGLVAWEGLEPSAVAAVLGCSAGAARVRLHRARKRFSRELRSAEADVKPAVAQRPSGGRRSMA